MAELVFLNPTNTQAGKITSDMFGHVVSTDTQDMVIFKLDPRLQNVCAAMGTKMVDGMEVRLSEVTRIEVPDRLYDAITASLSLALLRKWSGLYVSQGMPKQVLELLREGSSMADITRSGVPMNEGADLRTATLLTYDYSSAVTTIFQFIQNLDNPVQAVSQRVQINELKPHFWHSYRIDEFDEEKRTFYGVDEEKKGVYVAEETQIQLMNHPIEQVQTVCLLDQALPIMQIDDLPQISDPDNTQYQAEGTVTMFVPADATEHDRMQLFDLLSCERLRRLLVVEALKIEPETVKVVPRHNPQHSDTPVLESGNANEPTPDIPHRTLESNVVEDDIELGLGSDQQYIQDPEPENRPRNGYGFDY